ncbi:unnamed protein product [Toxocara canis]|uniref:Neur_chan_LBD domain-containing protein n=1 Tax=Toxocara canis TaxID=6265 RepID=A0A183VC54_TOXCA|nr:unnamed protein product [Toxocara canis]
MNSIAYRTPTVSYPVRILSTSLNINGVNADAHYKESVMSTDVLVNFQGNVSWSAAGIFKSSCPLDVRYYPFDYQATFYFLFS